MNPSGIAGKVALARAGGPVTIVHEGLLVSSGLGCICKAIFRSVGGSSAENLSSAEFAEDGGRKLAELQAFRNTL